MMDRLHVIAIARINSNSSPADALEEARTYALTNGGASIVNEVDTRSSTQSGRVPELYLNNDNFAPSPFRRSIDSRVHETLRWGNGFSAKLNFLTDEDKVKRQSNDTQDRIQLIEDELLRLRLAYEAEQSETVRLRDELGRKNRDITALTVHVDTLSQHLETARAADANTYLHTKKDSVFETESLKARLSRAERERDALLFQVQETERRSRMERDEEAALREEVASRAAEHERRAAYAELQRARSEAEAGAARHQMEHWRAAARAAQNEVAGLRAELDMGLRSEVLEGSLREPATRPSLGNYLHVAKSASKSTSQLSDAQAATELLKRQQQLVNGQSPPDVVTRKQADEESQRKHKDDVSRDQAKLRLTQIAGEIARLNDAMEEIGPPAGRTLNQRLQREQLRKQIDELNREAAKIRAMFPQS